MLELSGVRKMSRHTNMYFGNMHSNVGGRRHIQPTFRVWSCFEEAQNTPHADITLSTHMLEWSRFVCTDETNSYSHQTKDFIFKTTMTPADSNHEKMVQQGISLKHLVPRDLGFLVCSLLSWEIGSKCLLAGHSWFGKLLVGISNVRTTSVWEYEVQWSSAWKSWRPTFEG